MPRNGVCEPASRKEQSLPSCVGGVHRALHHRTSRGAARRHQRDRNATHNGVCEPASRKEQTLPSCVGGVHRALHHRTSRGAARRHQRDRNATHNGVCEPAPRKEPTLPSCVGGVHRARHHRTSRGAARRHQRDRRHARETCTWRPRLPCTFRDARRTCRAWCHLRKFHAHLRELHSASRHLRLGGILQSTSGSGFHCIRRGNLLWISRRNSAFWRGSRHSALIHKEKTNEPLQHLHCWRQTPPLRGSVVPAKLLVSGIHVSSFQSDMECDVYVRMNVYVNAALSSGTNMVPKVCMTSTTWRLRLLQHLPSLMVHHSHLWCTSRDVLGTVSCLLCGSCCCCPSCDLHGRGRVGCSGTRHHERSCTAMIHSAPPAVTYELLLFHPL